MEVEKVQDLKKQVDSFTIDYIEGGRIITATLYRASPKVWELAYYLDVMERFHKGASKVTNTAKYVEWVEEVKHELFLYFCEENKWLTMKHFESISESRVMDILNKIVKIYADLAEEVKEGKKKSLSHGKDLNKTSKGILEQLGELW